MPRTSCVRRSRALRLSPREPGARHHGAWARRAPRCSDRGRATVGAGRQPAHARTPPIARRARPPRCRSTRSWRIARRPGARWRRAPGRARSRARWSLCVHDAGASRADAGQLLANAIDVSPAGATIVLSTSSVNGWAEVRVRDEGPGMTESERSRAFDRFWRARSGGTASASPRDRRQARGRRRWQRGARSGALGWTRGHRAPAPRVGAAEAMTGHMARSTLLGCGARLQPVIP